MNVHGVTVKCKETLFVLIVVMTCIYMLSFHTKLMTDKFE